MFKKKNQEDLTNPLDSAEQDSREQDNEDSSSEAKLQTIAENLSPEERTQLLTILKNMEFKDKTSSDRMLGDE